MGCCAEIHMSNLLDEKVKLLYGNDNAVRFGTPVVFADEGIEYRFFVYEADAVKFIDSLPKGSKVVESSAKHWLLTFDGQQVSEECWMSACKIHVQWESDSFPVRGLDTEQSDEGMIRDAIAELGSKLELVNIHRMGDMYLVRLSDDRVYWAGGFGADRRDWGMIVFSECFEYSKKYFGTDPDPIQGAYFRMMWGIKQSKRHEQQDAHAKTERYLYLQEIKLRAEERQKLFERNAKPWYQIW
jgi:hypothetical protein